MKPKVPAKKQGQRKRRVSAESGAMKRKLAGSRKHASSPNPVVKVGRYYLLVPKDQRQNNWVLHTESPRSGVKLRSRYADLRCPNCGKVDEDAAIAKA